MSVPESPRSDPDSLAVAGVVHDVNQMLAVISGRAGLLLGQGVDSRWVPHLQAIALASADAATMLRRLSASAEAATGSGEEDLRTIAEQAKLLVWPSTEKGYQWCNRIQPGLATLLSAQVVREVLANLVLNGLAVMPEGGELCARAEEGKAGRVHLSLTDSGPGLPAQQPNRIFDQGVTGSGQAGRGVGLAGCRQLLSAAGGCLTARQRADRSGAVFELDLPSGPAACGARPAEVSRVPAMGVLVVDDETVVREMLADVLGSWGCQVQSCRDGQMALADYVPGTAVVALIDRNLPGLTGVELATRLRDSDPCLSIVLMTGWQDRTELTPVDSSIVDQEAEKPLAVERLREILATGYRQHETRQARSSQT